MKGKKHIQNFSEYHLNESHIDKIGREREEVIELLSSSSNFELEELNKKSDDELSELWDSLEMDDWLEKLKEN